MQIFDEKLPVLKKTSHVLPASTAVVHHEITGDIGGNAQETIIEVVSDGGQFPFTDIEKTESGFRIRIIGTWEAGEFFAAMKELAAKHGDWKIEGGAGD